MDKTINYIGIVGVLIAVYVLFIKPPITITDSTTITWYDTTAVEKSIEKTLTPKIKAELLKNMKPEIVKEIKWKNKAIDMDSLFQVALDSAHTIINSTEDGLQVYTATDSLEYEDSLQTLAIKSIVISRLPLDPELQNRIEFESTQKKISAHTKEKIYIKEKFSHGIQAGFGYGLINKEFDVFLGYGFQLNF